MGSLADNLENILKPCALGGHAGPLPIDVGALLHMNQAASGVPIAGISPRVRQVIALSKLIADQALLATEKAGSTLRVDQAQLRSIVAPYAQQLASIQLSRSDIASLGALCKQDSILDFSACVPELAVHVAPCLVERMRQRLSSTYAYPADQEDPDPSAVAPIAVGAMCLIMAPHTAPLLEQLLEQDFAGALAGACSRWPYTEGYMAGVSSRWPYTEGAVVMGSMAVMGLYAQRSALEGSLQGLTAQQVHDLLCVALVHFSDLQHVVSYGFLDILSHACISQLAAPSQTLLGTLINARKHMAQGIVSVLCENHDDEDEDDAPDALECAAYACTYRATLMYITECSALELQDALRGTEVSMQQLVDVMVGNLLGSISALDSALEEDDFPYHPDAPMWTYAIMSDVDCTIFAMAYMLALLDKPYQVSSALEALARCPDGRAACKLACFFLGRRNTTLLQALAVLQTLKDADISSTCSDLYMLIDVYAAFASGGGAFTPAGIAAAQQGLLAPVGMADFLKGYCSDPSAPRLRYASLLYMDAETLERAALDSLCSSLSRGGDWQLLHDVCRSLQIDLSKPNGLYVFSPLVSLYVSNGKLLSAVQQACASRHRGAQIFGLSTLYRIHSLLPLTPGALQQAPGLVTSVRQLMQAGPQPGDTQLDYGAFTWTPHMQQSVDALVTGAEQA